MCVGLIDVCWSDSCWLWIHVCSDGWVLFTCVLFGWQCVVYVPVVDAVCCGQISRVQGMKADTGTLMALCEKTDNDIRSCINTLQVCVCVHFNYFCPCIKL